VGTLIDLPNLKKNIILLLLISIRI